METWISFVSLDFKLSMSWVHFVLFNKLFLDYNFVFGLKIDHKKSIKSSVELAQSRIDILKGFLANKNQHQNNKKEVLLVYLLLNQH